MRSVRFFPREVDFRRALCPLLDAEVLRPVESCRNRAGSPDAFCPILLAAKPGDDDGGTSTRGGGVSLSTPHRDVPSSSNICC